MSEREIQTQQEAYSGLAEQMSPSELAMIMSRLVLKKDYSKIKDLMLVARAQSEAARDIDDNKAYEEYSIVEDFGWFEVNTQDPNFHPVNVPNFNLFHDLVHSNSKS